jgi:hypothetical protein
MQDSAFTRGSLEGQKQSFIVAYINFSGAGSDNEIIEIKYVLLRECSSNILLKIYNKL